MSDAVNDPTNNPSWHATSSVLVLGVRDGQVTGDPKDKQRFPTLVAARMVFPDLTPDLPGHRFTGAFVGEDSDEMQFRVRDMEGEALFIDTEAP